MGFLHLSFRCRHAKTPLSPILAVHHSDSIRKCRLRLDIPGGLSDGQETSPLGLMSQQSHPLEQAHQNGCGAGDGFGRPLALGFDTQMHAHFLKGHFALPTTGEPGQDLVWGSRLVRAKQRSGLELAIGVADEYPADGNCGHAVVIPDRRIRADFHLGWPVPIPVGHGQGMPVGFRVYQDLLQLGQFGAFLGWSSHLVRAPWRRQVIQRSVQSQASDHVDRLG